MTLDGRANKWNLLPWCFPMEPVTAICLPSDICYYPIYFIKSFWVSVLYLLELWLAASVLGFMSKDWLGGDTSTVNRVFLIENKCVVWMERREVSVIYNTDVLSAQLGVYVWTGFCGLGAVESAHGRGTNEHLPNPGDYWVVGEIDYRLVSVPDREHASSLVRAGGSWASTCICDLASSSERKSLGSVQAPGC